MKLVLLFVLSLLTGNGVFAQAETTEKFVDEIEAIDLRVFPNPTTDSFAITDNLIVDEIVLYNIIGRKVRTLQHSREKKYNIEELPDGMYFVSLISKENGVLKTVRISKRTMRP